MESKMKKRNWLNMAGLLFAAMLVLSIFSGIAGAETSDDGANASNERDTSTDGIDASTEATDTSDGADITNARSPKQIYTRTREQYDTLRQKYEDGKDKFTRAEENFRDARQKYRSARDGASRNELLNVTKEYLERAADQIISHLEIMKSRIENSDTGIFPFDAAANIDERIAQFEDIKVKIQQADTPQELTEAGRQLRDQWVKTKLETRYYIGILLNHRIDNFLDKTDNVSMKMDEVIERLKDQGKDTAKLEEYTQNFNELVSNAKGTHQKTLELYEIHEGFDTNGQLTEIDDARNFLNEAYELKKDIHRTMKAAAKELRNFFIEAKKLNSGTVVLRGTGTLEAHGTGRAAIEGDVTVTVSGNVTDLIVSRNAEVNTDSIGTETGDGNVKYQGFGSATIKGDDIRVKISGSDIDLTVTGTGRAVLQGTGTYSTEKGFDVSGEWSKEG